MFRFVILSASRCGSTTMGLLMKAHPDIDRLAHEPFNPMNISVMDDIGLRRRELWHFYEIERRFKISEFQSGVKIMFRRVGKFRVFQRWLSRDNLPLILPLRRNVLRQSVSYVLAQRTNEWTTIPEGYESQLHGEILLDEIRQKMSWVQWQMQWMNKWSYSLGDRCFRVYYEDFYLHDGWIETLPRLYEFCGLSPTVTTEAVELMKTRRINHEGIYSNIANVEEIDAKLGSDETGWLLL